MTNVLQFPSPPDKDKELLESASRQVIFVGWEIANLTQVRTDLLARLRFGHGEDVTNAAGEIQYWIQILTAKLAELERIND